MGTRGRIVIDLFTTLDGVAQAPGAPDEDPSGGFRFGGWQWPYDDEVIGERVGNGIRAMDALVLGRRTYDIFAAYWPGHTTGPAGFIGRHFGAIAKYVATRGTPELTWEGTRSLGPQPLAALDALRDRHREIHIIGSVEFVHSVCDARVFDELNLWVHPVVLGEGRRVFPAGAAPTSLRLLEPAVTGSAGVVALRYGPGGAVRTGEIDG